MSQRIFFLLTALFCLSFPSLCSAQEDSFRKLKESVVRVTLSNGLRVIIYKRDNAPIFTGQVWVKVGGVNEVTGVTGVSHLLEHMAFKGTTTIGTRDYQVEKPLLKKLDALMLEARDAPRPGLSEDIASLYAQLEKIWVDNEFSKIYKERGSTGLNAGTSKDYTVYMVSLPTSAFELWCWMESERLLKPVFRQFYKERDVVQEERRLRVEDNPGGRLYETLLATAYQAHPNRLPVIGWRSDIHGLTRRDIEELYASYYRPDNMVVTLVGDVDTEKIKPLLQKYFGRIPASQGPIPQVRTLEEPQAGERQAVVQYDAEPQLLLAYHKPVYPNPDDASFAILHSVLSDGRSSLLYKDLVQKRQLATSVYTSEAPGELFPSLFVVGATPREGVSVFRLRNELQKKIDFMKTHSISDEQLASAKRRVRIDFLRGLTSNYGMARVLGRSELLFGDWQVLFQVYEQINRTTAEDVMRIAEKYLHKKNRTFVYLQKGGK